MIEDIEDEDGFFVDIDSDEEVSLDVIDESDNTPKLVAENIDDAFFVDIDNEEAQNEIVAELEDEEIKFSENYTDDEYIKDTYVGDEYFVDIDSIDSDASATDKSPGYIQEAEPEGLFANLWKGLFFADRPRAADAGALQEIFEQKAGFGDGELNWDAISSEFMEGLGGEDHGTMTEYFKNKIIQVSENPENYPYASKIIPALNTLLYVPNIILEAMGNNVLPNPARDATLLMSVLLYPKKEDGTSSAPAPLLDMVKKVSNTYQATGETSLKKTMENMDSYATDKLALIAGFITDVAIDPITYTTGIIKYVAKTGKYVIPDKVLTYMADKSGYTKAKIKAAFLSTNTGQSLSEASDQFWKMFSTRHGLTPQMYEAQLKFKNLVSAARQVSVRDNKELKARIEQYAKDTGVSYEDVNKFIVEAVERGGIPNVNFKNLSQDSIEILSKSDDIRYEVWALATKNEAQLVAEIKGGISLKELGEQVLVNQADKGEMLLFYFNHAITPQARKLALKKKVTEFTHGYKMFGKEGKLKYWFDNKHSSLLKRKKQWEGLTINDINDLAKNGKLPGYDGVVFKEGFFYTDAPVAQALRDFKHHKSMAAVQLVDDITGVNGFGMSPDSIVLAAKKAGWKTKRKMDYDNVVSITDDALKYLKSSKHGDEALQNKWLGYEVTTNEFTRGYALPKEIMDFVETSFKTINGPKEINKFLTHYDEMTRWFKSWTLSIFPSYHVRNKVGNMWNNHVMGVELKSYKDALKIQTNLANGTEGFIDIYVSGKRAKERISYTKFQELLDKHGVIGRGLFTADIETSLIQEMGKAKWLTLSADNKAIAIGKKVGENVENNARIANFLHHLRKGDTPADAAKQVQIALFDYADLTNFEQDVMKRIFPFYTWSRKNIPFQLQQMIKHPGKYKAVETLRRDLEAVISPEDENEKYLSTWMLANYPAKVKIDSDGNPKYFMLGGWWAGADVWKLGSSPTKLVTDLLHPVLKVLYEQAGADEDGYITDTFSGQKLHPELNTDYMFGWDGNRMRVSQTTKHYLNNLRVLSTIDDFITSYYINQYPDKKRITMFGRKPTTIEESLLAFITGVRSFSVDLENQKLFATFDDANASDLYIKLVNEAIKNRAPDSEIEELMQKSVDSIKGMSKGGVVSQMNRLSFADGGVVSRPNTYRRKFADGGRVDSNKLINKITGYNKVASDSEATDLFNTADYKDQGFYGEVKDNKIFINRPLFETNGATGNWEEEFILFESMHNLKKSAPEWYDKLYKAANKDPEVLKEKKKLFSYAVKNNKEKRSIEDWWSESQFDQIISTYLFAGKDANIPSMREWSQDDTIFGTGFKKELKSFEKALGLHIKTWGDLLNSNEVSYMKEQKFDADGNAIPMDFNPQLVVDEIPKAMKPPITYTEEEKVKAEEIAAAGEALKTELKRWMKATGELQNKKKEAKLASQEIMDEIQTELKAVSTAKENIVKDNSTRTTPDWLVTAGKQISDGLRKDSWIAKQKNKKVIKVPVKKEVAEKKEIKDEGRGLKGYTLPKKTDKPGWKLPEEGGNYWSIDTAHAHWQTDKGQKEAVKLFGKKPGWVKNKSFYDTNRQKFAEGGNVEAPIPFTGLKDYIVGQITDGDKKWDWTNSWIRDKMVEEVNAGFLRLGPDPAQEKIINFYNKAIPEFEKYLGKNTAVRITDAYEIAFDDYFNYDIPGSESEGATKVAEASAVAGGGSTLLSQGKEWWNKGRNVRVPGENKASWKTLLKDSVKQLTKSDAAFKASKTGLSTLRPFKAFTPSMLGTGPDPATRQLVSRTGNLLSKVASAVPRWLSAPLQILNPSPLTGSTVKEMYGVTFGTPEYEEWEKNSMAKQEAEWKNYNNSLLESRQVKSNIANKRDKREGVRQAKAEDEARADARERARALEAEQIRAQKIADKQAKEHAKAMEDRNKNTVVDNQGNKGYTGTGNQSRAPKPPPPAANPPQGGTSKNYGVTGKRVTGGR